jgi:hypothetical protein
MRDEVDDELSGARAESQVRRYPSAASTPNTPFVYTSKQPPSRAVAMQDISHVHCLHPNAIPSMRQEEHRFLSLFMSTLSQVNQMGLRTGGMESTSLEASASATMAADGSSTMIQ